MILLGLTGSIGMGKSTTSAMFRAEGLPVYDADAAVHKLYAGAAVAPLGVAFPDAIVDGRVNRAILSRKIMAEPTTLQKLEEIVHPLVGADRTRFISDCAQRGHSACILDIPLLFETGGERAVDVVVVVSANAEVQKQRVLMRPDMSAEKFATILSKQVPDLEKRRRSHFVVDTGGGLDFARRQVAALLACLRLKG